jgi:serine/threonine-protein kinase HipA
LVESRTGYKKQISFYYDSEFIKAGIDIAPLSASIFSIAAQRGLPIYPEKDKAFEGLPAFISDSLPDHWGNSVFNEWAKKHGKRQRDLSSLDRLAYIGSRGMGALEFRPPAFPDNEVPFKVQIKELTALAQDVLKNAGNFKTNLSENLQIESLFKVGTSAGGRRPKAVINFNPATGDCYSGQVYMARDGFIPMIIKFDEHSGIPTTLIEYSYWLLAQAAGLNMMPSILWKSGDESHFLTQRFDRKGAEKLHIQTLAAMMPNATSYEELFLVANKLGIAPEEFEMLFRQMILNILTGNVDDHSKNFSFIMNASGEWHIAPAYDFTFAVDPSAPGYINRHSLTLNGTNEHFTKRDLLSISRAFSIKRAEAILDEVMPVVQNYRRYAKQAGVPEEWTLKIEAEIADRIADCLG